MNIQLKQIIYRFGGKLKGNPQIIICNIAPLNLAKATHITFLSNKKFLLQAEHTKAAALILSIADDSIISHYSGARIIVDNPHVYFARVAQLFATQKKEIVLLSPGIHNNACISKNAMIAPSAVIGPYVVIESEAVIGERVIIDAGSFIGHNARIGNDTHCYANVILHFNCEIGERCIVHSGAIIGADGFGFANEDDGSWIKIPQIGRVIISHDVEIGANTTIDRGTITDTIIEEGVKLDNQIQIAHNCYIGAHTAIAGCVGIAGSTKIGKFCAIGGAAMINDHITIADKIHISAGTFVLHSLFESGKYTGFYPVAKHADWSKSAVLLRNLGTMRKKIQVLENMMKSLIKCHHND